MRLSVIALVLSLLAVDAAEAQGCGPGLVWNYCTCGPCSAHGPAHWATIADPACSGTKVPQSPAALTAEPAFHDVGPLTLRYGPASLSLEHVASAIKLFPSTAQGILLGPNQTAYVLKELHFHVPPEHELAGVKAVAELHLVHEAAGDPRPVAIGVFLIDSGGVPNQALDSIVSTVGTVPLCSRGTRNAEADLSKIVPKELAARFLEYGGSLTTPPCGAVRWIILPQPIRISKQQLDSLNLFGSNARPTQPAAPLTCWPRGETCG